MIKDITIKTENGEEALSKYLERNNYIFKDYMVILISNLCIINMKTMQIVRLKSEKYNIHELKYEDILESQIHIFIRNKKINKLLDI